MATLDANIFNPQEIEMLTKMKDEVTSKIQEIIDGRDCKSTDLNGSKKLLRHEQVATILNDILVKLNEIANEYLSATVN